MKSKSKKNKSRKKNITLQKIFMGPMPPFIAAKLENGGR